jgi:hypothetical protein
MKNGSTQKRSTARTAKLAPEVKAATCVTIPVEPIDAPMWPIHPAGWLQPEAPAAAPSWTGLTIERRNRIPAPDLIQFPLAPFSRTGAIDASIDASREALFPAARPIIRQSDLAPLGWDPRATSPIKESQ